MTASGLSVSVRNIRITLQETAPSENNLLNHITNVQHLLMAGYANTITSIDAPENVFIDITNSDATAILPNLIKNNVLPTFEVDSAAEVWNIKLASNATGNKDINLISNSVDVLEYASQCDSEFRRGLALTKETIDSKTPHELRALVRSAPATFCVIPSECVTKELVYELQELCVAVWVRITSEPNTDAFVVDTVKAATAGVNGIISKSASAVDSAINNNFVENAMTRTSIMIGHRGNPGAGYVGNSMSSFIAAYANGADILEIDVERTLDGVPVIAHADSDFADTTTYNGTKKISECNLAELQSYNLINSSGTDIGEPIPTLAEVIEEFKDKDIKVFLEFKNTDTTKITVNGVSMSKQEACVKSAMELIIANVCEDMFDVISFEEEALTYTQKYLPGMSTGFLCSPNKSQWIYPYLTLDATTEFKATNILLYDGYGTKENEDEMKVAQKYNSTVNPSNGDLSDKYFKEAADRGMTVWPWTFWPNGAFSLSKAFIGGCDGITTDYVNQIKNMAKFAYAEDFIMKSGTEASVSLTAETYGGTLKETILPDDMVISVVDGKDVVNAENGKLVGLKAGTATVILGYKTKTWDNIDYVLYTEPITVTVEANHKETLVFASVGLTITDDIATNYKVNRTVLTSNGYTDPYVVFEMNGKETTVTKYTVVDDKLVFNFENIAPHEMNNTITATLYEQETANSVSAKLMNTA